MQLTAHSTRYSIARDGDVSWQHDGFYGHVFQRSSLPGIFEHDALA